MHSIAVALPGDYCLVQVYMVVIKASFRCSACLEKSEITILTRINHKLTQVLLGCLPDFQTQINSPLLPLASFRYWLESSLSLHPWVHSRIPYYFPKVLLPQKCGCPILYCSFSYRHNLNNSTFFLLPILLLFQVATRIPCINSTCSFFIFCCLC